MCSLIKIDSMNKYIHSERIYNKYTIHINEIINNNLNVDLELLLYFIENSLSCFPAYFAFANMNNKY